MKASPRPRLAPRRAAPAVTGTSPVEEGTGTPPVPVIGDGARVVAPGFSAGPPSVGAGPLVGAGTSGAAVDPMVMLISGTVTSVEMVLVVLLPGMVLPLVTQGSTTVVAMTTVV